ncbi:hypothetical protein B4N89_09920 [Embleya scabrispora]|uniref:Uncharacterized protein n=1 Tax=Embleya scabrispora TaxID=159449 RepID=A0A1T3NX25_9ACTN|nr:hypothetical protein B4N89_09920 [Embleya scabrispora]
MVGPLYVFHVRGALGPDHSMPTHGYLVSLEPPADPAGGDTAQAPKRAWREDHNNTSGRMDRGH